MRGSLSTTAAHRAPQRCFLVCLLVLSWLLTACSSGPKRPLTVDVPERLDERDYPEPEPVDPATIPEPVPRHEPLARYGNHSPYTVMGRTYRVMAERRGYRARGIASWYGTKFHGRLTSTREPYDMYSYTAAHKTLPLPTYVRVTNLDNDKSVIVRVNDRGPFVGNREIDLSYLAAVKLDMHMRGTAPVLVEVLEPVATHAGHASVGPHPDAQGDAAAPPVPSGSKPASRPSAPGTSSVPAEPGERARWFLQLGAFSAPDNARMLAARMQQAGFKPLHIVEEAGAAPYRVLLGPFANALEAAASVQPLEHAGFPKARVIQR